MPIYTHNYARGAHSVTADVLGKGINPLYPVHKTVGTITVTGPRPIPALSVEGSAVPGDFPGAVEWPSGYISEIASIYRPQAPLTLSARVYGSILYQLVSFEGWSSLDYVPSSESWGNMALGFGTLYPGTEGVGLTITPGVGCYGGDLEHAIIKFDALPRVRALNGADTLLGTDIQLRKIVKSLEITLSPPEAFTISSDFDLSFAMEFVCPMTLVVNPINGSWTYAISGRKLRWTETPDGVTNVNGGSPALSMDIDDDYLRIPYATDYLQTSLISMRANYDETQIVGGMSPPVTVRQALSWAVDYTLSVPTWNT